jgi:hypothetical protein
MLIKNLVRIIIQLTMTYDEDSRLATVNGSSVTSDLDGNLTSAPLTNGQFALNGSVLMID